MSPRQFPPADDRRRRRVALAVTTVGVLTVTLNSSILLISLPAIFGGLGLQPLAPDNISYLLWMIMGFLVVTAVLVVTFGRLGDQYGRAKLFNAGFLVFTVGAVGCAVVPNGAAAGALEIIVLRIVEGIGGAMVLANSTALITDAFPPDRRGFALGVNQVAALAGSFLGLVVGGVLSEWSWRAVFWISVPFGVWGTGMGYRKLRDPPRRRSGIIRIDWIGNLTFAVGLVSVLVASVYGLQPYGSHAMGWTSPKVLWFLVSGIVLLVVFAFVEVRAESPMIDLRLFRIRAFSAAQAVNVLASMSRGGLQFMLIVWLQGIWLPLHGYTFEQTPLWAGIYMLPLTLGFLLAGPASGALSDRLGARAFASGGLLLSASTFLGLVLLPTDFDYPLFATLLALNGIGMGLMAAPNSAAIMNAVPASDRGAASGIRATGMNAGMVVSMAGFFTLMAVGLASRLPHALRSGLLDSGVDPHTANVASHVSPVGSLFAAFLGDDPIHNLVPNARGAVADRIYDRHFFPRLISDPFHHGLTIAFSAATVMLLLATAASLMRGARYVHEGASEEAHANSAAETFAVREGADSAAQAIRREGFADDRAIRRQRPSPADHGPVYVSTDAASEADF